MSKKVKPDTGVPDADVNNEEVPAQGSALADLLKSVRGSALYLFLAAAGAAAACAATDVNGKAAAAAAAAAAFAETDTKERNEKVSLLNQQEYYPADEDGIGIGADDDTAYKKALQDLEARYKSRTGRKLPVEYNVFSDFVYSVTVRTDDGRKVVCLIDFDEWQVVELRAQKVRKKREKTHKTAPDAGTDGPSDSADAGAEPDYNDAGTGAASDTGKPQPASDAAAKPVDAGQTIGQIKGKNLVLEQSDLRTLAGDLPAISVTEESQTLTILGPKALLCHEKAIKQNPNIRSGRIIMDIHAKKAGGKWVPEKVIITQNDINNDFLTLCVARLAARVVWDTETLGVKDLAFNLAPKK